MEQFWVEDAGSEETIHLYVTCDGCGSSPLTGLVMKCSACENFDFCATCYSQRAQFGHPDDHSFYARSGNMHPATFQASVALLSRLIAGANQMGMNDKPMTRPARCTRRFVSPLTLGWLVFLSPLRRAQAAFMGATLGTSAIAARCLHGNAVTTYFDLVFLVIATWIVPLVSAFVDALHELVSSGFDKSDLGDLWRYELLPQGTMRISPHQLHYSTQLLPLEPVRGRLVYEPLSTYSLTAFFRHGRLMTTDNDVLYSAKHNEISQIDVLVIQTPDPGCRWQSYSSVKVDYDTGSLALCRTMSALLEIGEDVAKSPEVQTYEPDVVARRLLLNPGLAREILPFRFVFLAMWLKESIFDVIAALKAQEQHGSLSTLQAVINTFFGSLSIAFRERLVQRDCQHMRAFVNFINAVVREHEPPEDDGPRLCSLQLPVNELTRNPRPSGHVLLEADRIVMASRGETLYGLIRERCPTMDIVQPEGERNYARVQAPLADEAVVRAVIKALARERGKRSNVKAIERVFTSPRD